ncbi:MAG: hypothetical protein E7054_04795 [Lentisphaerae bacterium]|nr:hypothetical protein [Lentisphaerota bacterium]
MKRHSYTITELLTVIAIIAILAAIAIPSVGYARRRARTANCISNQGQTMKTIINAMANHKNFLYSGTATGAPAENGLATEKASWSRFLAEKNYIKSMDGLRCPEMDHQTDGKTLTAASIKEAYGVVVASDAANGKFDFRGTKLFRKSDKTEIAPSALAIGGCATADGKTPTELLNLGSGVGNGKPTGVHNNNMVNMFFFDGHAESFDKNTFNENKYYPSQTSATDGVAVAIGSVWQDAVK